MGVIARGLARHARRAPKIAGVLQQRTLKSISRAVGVGLHSGQRVELTLRPAPADTGIVFRRVDLPEPAEIRMTAEAVTDTRLASTVSTGGAKVQTVEHLMSACAGLGIDNLYIDITADEVPILDGSASSFVFLLQSAGIEFQKAPRRFIRVLRKVEVREGDGANEKWAALEPYMDWFSEANDEELHCGWAKKSNASQPRKSKRSLPRLQPKT